MIRQWALWSLPRRLVAYVLMVELAAVTMTAALLVWFDPVRPSQLAGMLWVTMCAGLGVEISQWVERMRERHRKTTFKSFHGVWLMPTLLLFPPGVVCLLAAAIHAWVWWRVQRFTAYRWVMSTAGNILGAGTGALVFRQIAGDGVQQGDLPSGPAAIIGALAAGLVLVLVDLALVGSAILLADRKLGTRAYGRLPDQMIELAAVCIGLLVATAYTVAPPLIALALPPMAFLQRTLLFAQFQQAARTDAKTGLANATWWHELASREVERARRLDEEVSVLIADLDHFKRVNDTYGHLAGDVVLHSVANAFKASVREYDEVGRFGGEEFVVVLPSTGLAPAWEVAERLRRQVAALRVDVSGKDGKPQCIAQLSVSIGLASLPAQAGDLSDLLRLADAALYAAKESGRNRVCSTPGLGPTAPQLL